MEQILKGILIITIAGLTLFAGCVFYAASVFSFDDGKYYSKQDLIDNYKQKPQEISDLKAYISSITPDNKTVDIEFENNEKLFIFHLTEAGKRSSNWDLEISSTRTDSLLGRLSWTRENLKTIKAKLDAANCISVKNGEPCTIGFQRSGMGKYYYNLFDKLIPDSLKNQYNNGCAYFIYNDTMVLEYGGGAIGPQCFPK